MKTLGRALKKSRMDNHITQIQVSNKLGYTTSQFVSNWERGSSYPPPKALKKMAKLYGFNYGFAVDVMMIEKRTRLEAKLKKQYGLN